MFLVSPAIEILTKMLLFRSFSLFTPLALTFANTKEVYVYSGADAIALSPNKSSKRVDIIEKLYATDDEHIIKKRSHKRRRKVRRPRQGR